MYRFISPYTFVIRDATDGKFTVGEQIRPTLGIRRFPTLENIAQRIRINQKDIGGHQCGHVADTPRQDQYLAH